MAFFHPRSRPPKQILNPTQFNEHAAYRFPLVFQCVMNIGARGSGQIWRRVVRARTLDVVEASKGFFVGPSSNSSGVLREIREQQRARRFSAIENR